MAQKTRNGTILLNRDRAFELLSDWESAHSPDRLTDTVPVKERSS